jgi:hypothetical protein
VARRLTQRRSSLAGTALFAGASVVVMDTSERGVEALDAVRGGGFVNSLECDWAVGTCWALDRELSFRGESATVSVLTYYRSQAVAIRRLLDEFAPGFRSVRFEVVGTIDEALGRESDYAIVSFCRRHRSSGTLPRRAFAGLLQDVRRLRIALTRARRTVVLVGDVPTLRRLGGADSEFAAQFTRLVDS